MLTEYLFKKKEPKEVPLVLNFILIENQIQTTSASPCRTQVQPASSFLVCSLIFIEYKQPLSSSIGEFFDENRNLHT